MSFSLDISGEFFFEIKYMMYTIKNNEKYTNLISNLNFFNNNIINNYYEEMNNLVQQI